MRGKSARAWLFHFGEFFEEFYDRAVAFEVFFGELRDEFSDVVSAEFGFGGDFAGEEAAGEGREGHDADVMLDAIREDFLFAVSFDHGVQVLHGGDGRDFMGFGKDGNIDLGEAPAADFPSLIRRPMLSAIFSIGMASLKRCR